MFNHKQNYKQKPSEFYQKYNQIVWKLPQSGKNSIRLDTNGVFLQGEKQAFSLSPALDCLMIINNISWYGILQKGNNWNAGIQSIYFRDIWLSQYFQSMNPDNHLFILFSGDICNDKLFRNQFEDVISDNIKVFYSEIDWLNWYRQMIVD